MSKIFCGNEGEEIRVPDYPLPLFLPKLPEIVAGADWRSKTEKLREFFKGYGMLGVHIKPAILMNELQPGEIYELKESDVFSKPVPGLTMAVDLWRGLTDTSGEVSHPATYVFIALQDISEARLLSEFDAICESIKKAVEK